MSVNSYVFSNSEVFFGGSLQFPVSLGFFKFSAASYV